MRPEFGSSPAGVRCSSLTGFALITGQGVTIANPLAGPEPDDDVPVIQVAPHVRGFSGQMRGVGRDTLLQYQPRQPIPRTLTRADVAPPDPENQILTQSPKRVVPFKASTCCRRRSWGAGSVAVGVASRVRAGGVMFAGMMRSPTAWADRKASPTKSYHDATEIQHI